MESTEGSATYQPLIGRHRRTILFWSLLAIVAMTILVTIAIVLVLTSQSSGDVSSRQESQVTGDSGLPLLEWTDLEVPSDLRSITPFNRNEILLIPKGYGISVYGHVPNARFLLALPDGSVLVSQPKLGKVSRLKPPTSNTSGALRSDFASGLKQPHDMVLFSDGKGADFLYIAEANNVSRYPYKTGDSILGKGQVVAAGLPAYLGFRHPLKNIAVGNGTLYVAIGSGTNDDPGDLQSDPKRGAIYGYPLSGGEKRLVSEGIRNAEGLAFEPQTKELWVVVNQRDNVKYPHKDNSGKYGKVIAEYVDENPPEEFSKVIEGVNYGWPYCNPVASASMDNLEYVADYDNNRDEGVVKCSTFRRVDKGMEPHSAPLGLTFWTGDDVSHHFRGGALVAMHGSWNRRVISGTKVVFYPWVNGRPGVPYDLVSGWVTDAGKKVRWGRPVDTAVLKDGSVLISDDYAGAIYRLYKKIL